MKFDKLYLRVTALLNGREVHYDYVISPNADDLTDEKADLMKQELSESLLKDLPAGTKILSTEFIPETEMIAPIYAIQQITPDDYWRILKGIGVMRNFPTSQRILVKVVSLAELKRCTERRRKRFEENEKG